MISYSLGNSQAMEDILNEWLEDVGDIHIEECVPLGTDVKASAGALVVFYREKLPEARPFATSVHELCRQCKKNPPLEGMKMCEECREYQRKYRERQKEEKKKARYP